MKELQYAIQLSQIWIYPVKSLGGVRVKCTMLLEEGLQYDRRWMVVDEQGNFLTQRKLPQMSLLTVNMQTNGFLIHPIKNDDSPLPVCFENNLREQIPVKIWNDAIIAKAVGKDADSWLSEQLKMRVRLVTVGKDSDRKNHIKKTNITVPITFTDDFPIHLISESSLNDLNSRLHQHIGVQRFRPNFVIRGAPAYAEDNWHTFQIGEGVFENSSGCERCVMVNVDQHSGIKTTEPLRTLAGYRRVEKNILFGRNVICRQTGMIREGDMVLIRN